MELTAWQRICNRLLGRALKKRARANKELSDNLTNVSMTVDYEMPLGPLGNILDKVKFAKSAENGLETALFKVRGLLEGNGSIPVYITLDAYQKLLAEKKKMNNVPVSAVLTAILEKFEQEPEIKN